MKYSIKEIREILMKGDVVFSLKGSKDTFTTGKIHEWSKEGYSGYISKDMFSQMNVNKWGPTCVTLYTYNMLGKRISGKIRYADVRFVVSEEEAYVLSQLETNPLEKLDGFIGTENCPL